MEARHPDTGQLPAGAAGDTVRDAYLPSECPFQSTFSLSLPRDAFLFVQGALAEARDGRARPERSVLICSRLRGRLRTP